MHVIMQSCLLFIWAYTLNLVNAEEPADVRLVGGISTCSGTLEMKKEGEWKPVEGSYETNLKTAAVVCRLLDCGSAVSTKWFHVSTYQYVWLITSCAGSESSLGECGDGSDYSSRRVEVNCSESVRLVNGTSLCSGRVEVNSSQSWVPVCEGDFDRQDAEVVCRELGCGAPSVFKGSLYGEVSTPMWTKEFQCEGSESVLLDCGKSDSTRNTCSPEKNVGLTCSEPDDIRLVGGTSKCAGSLEMKYKEEWRPVVGWSDWNQNSSAVVCRQLDCGSAVLTEHSSGSTDESVWRIRSICVGSESSLRECVRRQHTTSTGRLEVTCSESVRLVNGTSSSPESGDVRLVGGTSHCTGRLEMNQHGEWRPVCGRSDLNLKTSAIVCRQLDCGSAVSSEKISGSIIPVWRISSACDGSESSLRECVTAETYTSHDTGKVICSESVRMVNGTSSCSGRVEVKSNQLWVSVCEHDFDRQDAKVVCRELGCGAPSVLQGALYGEVKAPMWTKEFQCEGSESVLLDCRTSDSTRNTCSPDKTVGLTCSEPVRLVGGTSHCSGILEVKNEGEWRPVSGWSDWGSDWIQKSSSVVCRQLDCGSVVSTERSFDSTPQPVWSISSSCQGVSREGFSLRECETKESNSGSGRIKVICSESLRLVKGTTSCSGRVEVKSNQSWVSVCEDDFDQQDAEVVCRELGCGAPSVLQGALYGEARTSMWAKEFQCEGSESALLDCGTSDSTRNTCSPDKTVGLTCLESDYARLVGGTNNCTGILEMKHQGEWRPVVGHHTDWTLKSSSIVCRQLDCGSAVSTQYRASTNQPVWQVGSVSCVGSESTLRDCGTTYTDASSNRQEVICSESVRLVNGTGFCSGRVEVKSYRSWLPVCEGDFDRQDAEVLCRELGCGAPSVLQGALYGEVKAPMWTKEFQCEGSESVLLDCGTSDSTRNTCSPDKTVGLTCSEPGDIRLAEGTSKCNGRLEMKHQAEWRPVVGQSGWDMKSSSVVCRQLGCGSAVSTKQRTSSSPRELVWRTTSGCVGTESSLRECVTKMSTRSAIRLDVICSESVRLVEGTGLCSGRVEVKSNQLWVSVCEGDFDRQDAEVVCRELGCGAPSVLQGALYGEVKAPKGTKEFQCEGSESVLLDCGTSDSARNTCSPDKTVGLTCSEPVRLVGGTNNCTGILELKHQGEWRSVDGGFHWSLKSAAVVCRQLDCGSAVSTEQSSPSRDENGWMITSSCVGSESSLVECGKNRPGYGGYRVEVICSESVRLVNGPSSCSGRVEVKSNQSWVSVCEGDFDQQDAEVVCRELGCGAPSVHQGALYGKVNAQMWTKEFQCEGSESVLLDCGTSHSTRNTCSPDNTVGLTCSEPGDVRLVGGTSKCNGRLEMKHQGEWRPMVGRSERDCDWNLKSSSVVCRQLDCGSAVSTEMSSGSTNEPVWRTMSSCVGSESSLKECVIKMSRTSDARLEVICSESVRLVNGNSLCSGKVEVRSNQSWVSVCEGDFDQQDAEVLCREMDCGAPSVLQGALYGESKSPTWTKEFQCEGSESVLLDCGTSDSTGNTCSPDKTVGLTCSEPDDVRLVGGTSHCTGIVEMKHQGEWRPVYSSGPGSSNLKLSSVMCRKLDCGSAVSGEIIYAHEVQPIWGISSSCVGSESSTRECVTKQSDIYPASWKLICSGPQTSLSS